MHMQCLYIVFTHKRFDCQCFFAEKQINRDGHGLFPAAATAATAQVGDHRNQRQEHGDDDAAEMTARKTIMMGFTGKSWTRRLVDVFVVIVGDAQEHFGRAPVCSPTSTC